LVLLAGTGTYATGQVAHEPRTVGAIASPLAPLRQRILSIADSQIGYRSDPPGTYCNKYSAYWHSGTVDCGNGNTDEEWCADFAAWVWEQAGAEVTYDYIAGDLNSSSASFYEWGLAHGTWHPASSGYRPQPGDVVIFGLDETALIAQHVAVVTSYAAGAAGPNVVNGDGDLFSFSEVDADTDVFRSITSAGSSPLSGYVSPTTAST